MRTFHPSELTPRQRHQYILGSIGPRPVAFVSTLNAAGRPNLAPFSFFNVFSSSPPVLAFSTGRRPADQSEKDTLRNIRQHPEAVINLVDYAMVRQMAIAGIEYPEEVSEFEKSGLTPLASEMVKPFRVQESPAQYECKIVEIKPLGKVSTLIFAEAVLIHLREEAFEAGDRISPDKMDLVGRLGGYNYCRASGEAVFQIVQPYSEIALGFDALPPGIRTSSLLTGNELALLAGVTRLPSPQMLDAFKKDPEFTDFFGRLPDDPALQTRQIHERVRTLLAEGKVEDAWVLVLVINDQ